MSRFIDNGIYKINSSLTKEEATSNFETSCSLCFRAGLCDESRCPIAKAYNNRLMVLESYVLTKNIRTEFVKTRKYSISFENQRKRKIQTFLTKLSKVAEQQGNRQAVLIIDDASVAMELDDIERMLDIVSKYPNLHNKIQKMLQKQ